MSVLLRIIKNVRWSKRQFTFIMFGLLCLLIQSRAAFVSQRKFNRIHTNKAWVTSNALCFQTKYVNFGMNKNAGWQPLFSTVNDITNFPSQEDEDVEIDETFRLKILENDLKALVDQVRLVTDETYIPSLLSKNIDLAINLLSEPGLEVIQSIVQRTITEEGEEVMEEVSQAIDIIVSFTEEFVQQASQIEQQNKKLLGKVITILSNKEKTAESKEIEFDEVMAIEREKFTPGFLRHVEGQCDRISKGSNITADSYRLLEILRLIQTRVLEELVSEKEWGEAAQVLGQLIGYPNKAERTAVLEAGLTVRGVGFANELLQLTDEALDGFKKVQGGVDSDLVEIINDLDVRIKEYILENENDTGFE